MKTLIDSVVTQTKCVILYALTNPEAFLVRVDSYNDETGRFEPDESYTCSSRIEADIEFNHQKFLL